MTEWVVLGEDVKNHEDYPKKSLGEILYEFGMDVSQGFITEDKTKDEKPSNWPEDEPFYGYNYRSIFTGKICGGPRYIGRVRSDGGWDKIAERLLESAQ